MDLTSDELKFLARHGFSEDDVFDARGKASKHWKAEAEEAGRFFVIGSPCKEAQHRLRTRGGHCAQCDPRKIAYQKRYISPGYVYVAGSLSARVAKIGTAVNIKQRQQNLRGQGYGGINDWRILFHVKVQEGGKVEKDALKVLLQYKTTRSFLKDGDLVDAGEILSCSVTAAIEAVKVCIGTAELAPELWISPRLIHYRF